MKAEHAGYAGGAYPKKKRRRVLLASLPQSSIGQKRIREDHARGRQVLGTSCCCKRVNTVEKQ
jgi:hypothetical protein